MKHSRYLSSRRLSWNTENILVVKCAINWLSRSQNISEKSKKNQRSLNLHYYRSIYPLSIYLPVYVLIIYITAIVLYVCVHVYIHVYMPPNSVIKVAMKSHRILGSCGFRVTWSSFDSGFASASYVSLESFLNSHLQSIIYSK